MLADCCPLAAASWFLTPEASISQYLLSEREDSERELTCSGHDPGYRRNGTTIQCYLGGA